MKARPNARLVSVRHAADELGLAYHTLWELVQQKHIPAVRFPGSRSIYLDRRDLERFINESKA
jgi:excisionase family DNA binding protein